jgi:hypothetical protein
VTQPLVAGVNAVEQKKRRVPGRGSAPEDRDESRLAPEL